jgi:hypothetical protein
LPNLKRYSSIKNFSLDLQWANCKLEWRKALFIKKMKLATFSYHEAQISMDIIRGITHQLGELKIESSYGIWGFMLFDYHQLPSTKTKPS